jgi:hypothetical protein
MMPSIAANSLHGQGAKQERYETANEQADDDAIVVEQERDVLAVTGKRIIVVGKQHEGGEAG